MTSYLHYFFQVVPKVEYHFLLLIKIMDIFGYHQLREPKLKNNRAFTKKIFIKNMIYQSFSAGTNSIGFLEELADNIIKSATAQKVVFTFT